jgi:type IV pilus assembly protein PilX
VAVVIRAIPTRAPGARRERGVVLWVAIIVLVAMTLAGLAMMRQMGAGLSIAGNIAFKESVTAVADRGAEKARVWLTNNPALLNNDNFAAGYHSSWAASVDPSTFNWAQAVDLSDPLLDPPNLDPGQTGVIAQLMYIERLCLTPNLSALDPVQVCSDKPGGSDTSRNGASYPTGIPPPPPQVYYRVTTRVDGPRNTRSYTQVLMQ